MVFLTKLFTNKNTAMMLRIRTGGKGEGGGIPVLSHNRDHKGMGWEPGRSSLHPPGLPFRVKRYSGVMLYLFFNLCSGRRY